MPRRAGAAKTRSGSRWRHWSTAWCSRQRSKRHGRRRRKAGAGESSRSMAKQMADAAKEAQEKKALKKHEEAQKDRICFRRSGWSFNSICR
ncbi:unnamed protein product [Effrenium voratum]|uniref:Uncharacterized protein n=1 Tax=Effrenium voratum TaxID=2562239 RepID=A0AA36IQ69_9DINO|nr:unnamed protein product [Effrenium voratum]